MLVAVRAGHRDGANERRGQLVHCCEAPRVPRFVPLRGQIGRLRETIASRTLMPSMCPTVVLGLAGTAGSVKTREQDLHLRFCELSGTSENLPEPQDGACIGAARCGDDQHD